MKISDKILKTSQLLAEALRELKNKGVDQGSDLILFLKDAEHASNYIYEQLLIENQ